MKRFEVLWYEKGDTDPKFKECSTKQAALNYYNKIKDNPNYYGFWVTKRNSDWEVVEEYIA